MKATITNSAKIVLSLSVILGMAGVVGAAGPIGSGTTSGGATATTTYTDPCGGGSGSGSTWTAPGSTPLAPGGNVAAPVNVSGTAQWKPGKLTLGSVPCPMPTSGWTPGSALTVNGITDTTGFSNWGSTFLQGVTSIGALSSSIYTSASGTPAPMLYVDGPDSESVPAGYRFSRAAAVFDGQVVVKGPFGSNPTTTKHWLYVGGYPVCNQSGAGCPTSTGTGTTTGAGPWTVSGANIYSNNTGSVGIGVAAPLHKLDVDGVINGRGNLYVSGVGIISTGLRLGAGGAPSNQLSVTGNADISGNLTVGGQSVCRQDGTNCKHPGDYAFNTMYMVVPQGDARSGTAGQPYRACAGLSSSTSLSGNWLWAGPGSGWRDNYYQNEGTITPYQYCRSSQDEGNYVWANPRAGKMFPY